MDILSPDNIKCTCMCAISSRSFIFFIIKHVRMEFSIICNGSLHTYRWYTKSIPGTLQIKIKVQNRLLLFGSFFFPKVMISKIDFIVEWPREWLEYFINFYRYSARHFCFQISLESHYFDYFVISTLIK